MPTEQPENSVELLPSPVAHFPEYLEHSAITTLEMDAKSGVRNRFRRFLGGVIFGRPSPIISEAKKEEIREKGEKARKLGEVLVTSEMAIDPLYTQILENVGAELTKKYPGFQMAIVLLGSAVHGGSQLRRIMNPRSSTDLDWGLVANAEFFASTKPKAGKELADFVEKAIKKQAQLLGVSIESCDYKNGGSIMQNNIPSAESFLSSVQDFWETRSSKDLYSLAYYFHPSFPAEINQKNQEIILSSLRQLHEANPGLWQKIVDEIILQWKRVHVIRTKHLNFFTHDDQPIDDFTLPTTHPFVKISAEAMAKPLIARLMKTAEPSSYR